jgi:putative transposase
MSAWRRRNGFPDVSHHTVDRLTRAERMYGVLRGRKVRTVIPAKDGRGAGDLLNLESSAPHPHHSWVTAFIYVATWFGFAFVYMDLANDLSARTIVG